MAYILDQGSGYALSQEHQRIAEIIKEYDDTLELQWIPPDKRDTIGEHAYPFRIFHSPEGKPSYVVRKLQEHEVTHELLGWLWMSDTARAGNDPVERLFSNQVAARVLALKEQEEQMNENHDIAASVLASPLNTYRHNGVVYQ